MVPPSIAGKSPARVARDARDARLAFLLGFLVWLGISFTIHTVLYLGGTELGCAGGNGGGGEEGVAGAGGAQVEFSVEGPEAETPSPAVPGADVPPPPEVPVEPVEVPRVEPRPREPRPDPVADHERPPPPEGTIEIPQRLASEAPATPAPPQGSAAAGTGADRTDSGRAPGVRGLILGSAGFLPGSVGQQRSMLPAAMTCRDPVAGVWRAHKYNPVYRDWAIFILRIRRGDGEKLEGTIWTRLWSGTPVDSRPPDACWPGEHHYTVRMTATGRAEGQRVEFGARSYRVQRAYCPAPMFQYNPDHFRGTIDPELQEFQSVNNDGGRDVNSPYVFRRVGCLDEGTPPGEGAQDPGDPVGAAPATPAPAAPAPAAAP